MNGRINAQTNGVTSYSCNISVPTYAFSFRSAFAIDNLGNKWIGFNNSGNTNSLQLVRFNGTNWDSFPHIPKRKINALAVDAVNNLWIGTDSGLVMFDGVVFTNYNTSNSGIASNKIISLATGGGNIYAGTYSGLCVFNGTIFTNYNHALNNLSHDTIYSITYESSSAVWLGNVGGLEKFYGSGFSYYNNLGGIGSDQVNCIYIDQANNKWLGTNANGVVKFDNTNFYTMQQLYNQFTIVGGYWPTTTKSICKGPSGGVSFELWSNLTVSATGKGLVELQGNQINFYNGVGNYFSPQYSIFQYDPILNKVFFINTNYLPLPREILHSFDLTQYSNDQYPIQSNNSGYLDINNVAALITSNDDMGWDESNPKYFVPKTSNLSVMKVSSLWIGGYHNGALKIGAMTYRQNGLDFWPGPLDTIQDTIDIVTQNAFNKVWKVNRFDIANFIYNWNNGNVQNGSFVPANSILTWPAHGPGAYSKRLAPFVDVNGNGIYDPIHDGDYPLIKGDQMIWHVFNDKANKHSETGAGVFGIEVQASAYAFICPNIADSNRVLNYTTFYNYKIVNRSQNKYDSCRIANWVDSDLGNYQDDYIGCDVINNYGYTYNGDNYDEDMNGMAGYHDNLPVFACNILSGPAADAGDGIDNNNNGIIDESNEKCMMSSFTDYGNNADPQTGNPYSPIQYYNLMNAKWKNGTPITFGGNGTNSLNPICRHLFPGTSDPYGISLGGSIANPIIPGGSYGATGWTQPQAGVVKNDMRFMTGIGPFTMQPGGTYEFDYAFVFSQDSANCLSDNICVLTRAQQDNIHVKKWFDNNSFPSCLSLNGVGVKQLPISSEQVNVYPNPANNYLFVEFKESKEKTTVEIFDILGNLVKAGIFNDASKYISIPVDELRSGIYNIQIKTGGSFVVKKFVKE